MLPLTHTPGSYWCWGYRFLPGTSVCLWWNSCCKGRRERRFKSSSWTLSSNSAWSPELTLLSHDEKAMKKVKMCAGSRNWDIGDKGLVKGPQEKEMWAGMGMEATFKEYGPRTIWELWSCVLGYDSFWYRKGCKADCNCHDMESSVPKIPGVFFTQDFKHFTV